MGCIPRPVISDTEAEADDRIRVEVDPFPSSPPDGYRVRVQFHRGVGGDQDEEPGEDLWWRLAGVLDVAGSVRTDRRPIGSTTFVRARGEAPGFLPTRWTTPISVGIDARPAFFQLRLVFDPGGVPRVTWTVNASTGGVKLVWDLLAPGEFATGANTDEIDAGDGQAILDATAPIGHTVVVEATPHETFEAGSVGGAEGDKHTLSRERTEKLEDMAVPVRLADGSSDPVGIITFLGNFVVPVRESDGTPIHVPLRADGRVPVLDADGNPIHVSV